MPHEDDIVERRRTPASRFVVRMHRMRMLGTALSSLPIASVLWERGTASGVWALLIANALLWPHVARLLSARARNTVAAEYRNLVIDAAMGGLWLAVIAVSLLPSAVLISVLTTDRLAAGGWRLLLRAMLAMAATFGVAWTLLGFPFAPDTSHRTLLVCLPLLFGYHMALSTVTYRLSRKIARQNRLLERLNRTDVSSDLPNRRHFDAMMVLAHARYQREGRQPALLLVDIDAFKTINDSCGHGMGDLVIRNVAKVLRESIRERDVPARIGGDEFAVLLPDGGLPAAAEISERIRARIAAMTFAPEPGLGCTVSIGVAALRDSHAAPDAWIRDADAALYRAKAGGRNQVVVA